MRCVRVFVFILLLIFTAAATCSSLFPLFRKKDSTSGAKFTVYYWYTEATLTVDTLTRTYTRDYTCEKFKTFYIVSGALSAAGAAFGGVATLMSLAHIYIRPKCCMCFGIMLFCFLAFGCFVVCVALTAVTYTTDSCSGDLGEVKKFKDQGYDLVEGFGLMCAAAGGYLIAFLLEIGA